MNTNNTPLYYDPFNPEIAADPYPVYQRMREDAPLYYNEKYDFYMVSRVDDVLRGLSDHETFTSGRGDIMEIIKANLPIPSGTFIFEDPPLHTIHRSLISRVFTPKKMARLEPQIREFCARTLDPLVGTGSFDFITHLGTQVPMRVISMMLGIPEEDQETIRDTVDDRLRTEPGQPMHFELSHITGEFFTDYIEWRTKNPSDDLMTSLLNVEFIDENGTQRKLTREEVLIYVSVIAGAGNETTNRLIGWTGKVLAEHPDQRAQIVADRSLVPAAIEEVLRYEPSGHCIARYVAHDAEFQGQTVPEGSVILFNTASANRDPKRFPNPDRFDIHRQGPKHLSFGHGIHTCVGAALARIEGCVVLDEVLNRFPEWDIDMSKAKLSSTSTVRGWDALPAITC